MSMQGLFIDDLDSVAERFGAAAVQSRARG